MLKMARKKTKVATTLCMESSSEARKLFHMVIML
jgi:hypothetical protein